MNTDKTPKEVADQDLDQVNGGESVARWNFENAWPTSTAAKGGTEVAMEEITLAVEGFDTTGDAGETPPLDVSFTLKR